VNPVPLEGDQGRARAYLNPNGQLLAVDLTPASLEYLEGLGLQPITSRSVIALPAQPRRAQLGFVNTPSQDLHRLNLEQLWALHDNAQASGITPVLHVKLEIARRLAQPCNLCHHRCNADRTAGEGWCRAPLEPSLVRTVLHVPEEVEGNTLMFYLGPGCSHRCTFCHTHDLVHGVGTQPFTHAQALQAIHDPNMCSARSITLIGGEPSIYLPWVLELALNEPTLPLVWNANMYQTGEVTRLLDGVIDAVIADLKFGNNQCARTLAGTHTYLQPVLENLHWLQAHDTPFVVRHVVMPGHEHCCTHTALEQLARVTPGAWLHLMPFIPAFKNANETWSSHEALEQARQQARALGFQTV
jgi:uncharacterized Fe-S radical SAM superfamily protein PflX